MASLDQLALKYGTDKGSTDHSYCEHYEQYLSKWRDEPITLLELGVWEGASMRMWREYFRDDRANIVGVDNNPKVVIDGVDIHIFNQDSKEDIEFCLAPYGGFDVIIDDASHLSSKTIASFKLLWPHLNPGGVYVIEDLQTIYDEANYPGEACANPEGIHRGGRTAGGRRTAMAFCKQLADEVNSSLFPEKYRLGYDVASVQFFPNCAFITKAG